MVLVFSDFFLGPLVQSVRVGLRHKESSGGPIVILPSTGALDDKNGFTWKQFRTGEHNKFPHKRS